DRSGALYLCRGRLALAAAGARVAAEPAAEDHLRRRSGGTAGRSRAARRCRPGADDMCRRSRSVALVFCDGLRMVVDISAHHVARNKPSLGRSSRRAAARHRTAAPPTPGGTVLLSLRGPIDARFLRYLGDPAELAVVSGAAIAAVPTRLGDAADAAVELAKLA